MKKVRCKTVEWTLAGHMYECLVDVAIVNSSPKWMNNARCHRMLPIRIFLQGMNTFLGADYSRRLAQNRPKFSRRGMSD